MVIVNTCGFIDSAVQESLEAIGEALNENGKVIPSPAAWAQKKIRIREVHPKKYWKSPGRIAMSKVRTHIITYRSRSTTILSLVPEQGVKLTPRHYAYLK